MVSKSPNWWCVDDRVGGVPSPQVRAHLSQETIPKEAHFGFTVDVDSEGPDSDAQRKFE